MLRATASVLALAFAVAPGAGAEPPPVIATASVTAGGAPLTVVLTAQGEAASYRWELGDGATAEGARVEHTYGAGFHTATLFATDGDGAVTRSEVTIVAVGLSLAAPTTVGYGKRAAFRARLVPALAGSRVEIVKGGRVVAAGKARADGTVVTRSRVTRPGAYVARFGSIVSAAADVRVQPRLTVSLEGSPTVGSTLRVRARLVPLESGRVRIRIWRGARLVVDRATSSARVPTRVADRVRARITTEAADGYAHVSRALTADVVEPRLGPGSRGPGVRALERRLSELHYALKGVDGLYAHDTSEAVLAFQKVHGLARTGRVDARLWRRLGRATVLPARFRGNHIEISKGRQVLFVVRGGRVVSVVHVSTGATGNTPLGRFRIYRKVTGWDWVLWYPMYFLRGFAIHGYPAVPAFPASHGCVRVPMWIAPKLFAGHGYGQTIYVYW